MNITNQLTLDNLFQLGADRIRRVFTTYLETVPSLELKNAMQYTLFHNGKHMRPLLIYATSAIFEAPLENVDIPAAAVELIHTYSLIHDDLPCMDDADLRRGKPACHIAHGEGLAVLTGDALHTLAMQIISTHPAALPANRRLQMIAALSKACGPYGMAAGQAYDITVMSDDTITTDLLETIYQLKTGALFSACIELGRLASNNDNELDQHALHQFGDAIGLAFQIQDDILDMEGQAESLGKEQGVDVKNNKMTYPKRYGIQHAKEKVQSLYQESLEAINYLGHRVQLLRDLVGWLLERNR